LYLAGAAFTTEGSNKPERKRKNLIRLGVEAEMAYQWSSSRMGGWAIAQSPILGTTITLQKLHKRGYESLLSYYEKVAPHLNERRSPHDQRE
jgi:RNA-directed DNA polymerase